MALSLFRFIAAVGRTPVVSNTLGTFALLIFFVMGGFIIAKDDIDPWMIWGYYISPMMYAQNAIVVNEFLDDRWSMPNLDPRINVTTVGKAVLKSKGFFTDERWYWICIAALFGFSVLFNVCFIAALSFLNPLGDAKAVTQDEDAEKKQETEGIGMVNRSLSANGGSTKRGMVLPFRPLSLAFNHVNYSVDMPAEMKSKGVLDDRLQLLCDVSGAFRPGILTALVGNFVEEVMDLVELNPVRDALVGLPGVDGLSTEQRKRLTIAVELVANPSIIFMDEPTSGLDARAAAIVMRTVRNTVDTGRTVVCTIHQPSIDIFEAFDELLLMKRGGQVIYGGPLGRHSHKLVEYFEAVPGVPKIKDRYNPATWMLEVSSPTMEVQLDVDFAQIYANSSLYHQNQELIKELSTPAPDSKDLYFPTQYSQSFTTQFRACFWKQNWSYWRNTQYNAVRFFLTFIIGVLFGLIFWKKGQKTDKQQDLMNILGAMYAAVFFLGATNASSVQPVVSVERTVFYRERAAGMYSALPYAFAQVSIEAIYVAFQTLIYHFLLYSMIGFEWKVGKFLLFYYYIYMAFVYFTLYGMMVVALTPGHQIAAICMSFFLSFWNLFAGFLIPRIGIPIWWRWYYWCSPVAWTLYGMVTSQVGDKDNLVEIPGAPSMRMKEFLQKGMGFEHSFLPAVAVAHLVFVCLFFFVFAFGIKYLNFQRR
ncbi:ABC transporter G family member 39 [Linum perenne]